MAVIFMSLIIQIAIAVVVLKVDRKMVWSVCLGWNFVIHNIIMSSLVLLSRASGSLYKCEMKFSNKMIENFSLTFGYNETSILYIWLVMWLSSLCIVTAKHIYIKREEYIFLVLYLQFCLTITFTADNLWIFCLSQLAILPAFLLVTIWIPATKKQFSPYRLFYTVFFVTSLIVVAIWGLIVYCGIFSGLTVTPETGRGFYFAILCVIYILHYVFKIPYFLFHNWVIKKGGPKRLKYSIMLLAFLFEFSQIALIIFLTKMYEGTELHVYPLFNICTLLVITFAWTFNIKRKSFRWAIEWSYITQFCFLVLISISSALYHSGFISVYQFEFTISIILLSICMWFFAMVCVQYTVTRAKKLKYFSRIELFFAPLFYFFLFVLNWVIYPNLVFNYWC